MSDTTDPSIVFNQIAGEDSHAYEGIIKGILQDIYSFRRVYHPAGNGGIVAAHDVALHDPEGRSVKIKSHDEKTVEIALQSKKTREVESVIVYKEHKIWVSQGDALVVLKADAESIPAALMISSALQAAVSARQA